MNEMMLTRIFCDVDDYIKVFEEVLETHLLSYPNQQRRRASQMTMSEIVTILIMFHLSGYRTFKHFYKNHVQMHWRREFPGLLSYTRFLELIQRSLLPLFALLQSRCGKNTGIAFVDSTHLSVCHNKRTRNHRVFEKVAKIGKSTMGWFYGFKLHLVVNDEGELLAFRLTPGNTDDRAPVQDMTTHIVGKLLGDKGYISKNLFKVLFSRGLQLVTHIRSNMKNRLTPLMNKILLRKRSLIETINDQLKNVAQIEHTRHRSVTSFLVNLLAGLAAYTFQPKRPSLKIDMSDFGFDFKRKALTM